MPAPRPMLTTTHAGAGAPPPLVEAEEHPAAVGAEGMEEEEAPEASPGGSRGGRKGGKQGGVRRGGRVHPPQGVDQHRALLGHNGMPRGRVEAFT